MASAGGVALDWSLDRVTPPSPADKPARALPEQATRRLATKFGLAPTLGFLAAFGFAFALLFNLLRSDGDAGGVAFAEILLREGIDLPPR